MKRNPYFKPRNPLHSQSSSKKESTKCVMTEHTSSITSTVVREATGLSPIPNILPAFQYLQENSQFSGSPYTPDYISKDQDVLSSQEDLVSVPYNEESFTVTQFIQNTPEANSGKQIVQRPQELRNDSAIEYKPALVNPIVFEQNHEILVWPSCWRPKNRDENVLIKPHPLALEDKNHLPFPGTVKNMQNSISGELIGPKLQKPIIDYLPLVDRMMENEPGISVQPPSWSQNKKENTLSEKPLWHTCPFCKYSNKLTCNLKRHLKRVHGLKDVFEQKKVSKTPSKTSPVQRNVSKKCPFPRCEYQSTRSNNLLRHITAMHKTEKKPTECCGQFFTTSGDKRKHFQQYHQNGAVFNCEEPMCKGKKPFSRHALLKRHQASCHGKFTGSCQPHQCHKCKYRSVHFYNLKRHLLAKHSQAGVLLSLPKQDDGIEVKESDTVKHSDPLFSNVLDSIIVDLDDLQDLKTDLPFSKTMDNGKIETEEILNTENDEDDNFYPIVESFADFQRANEVFPKPDPVQFFEPDSVAETKLCKQELQLHEKTEQIERTDVASPQLRVQKAGTGHLIVLKCPLCGYQTEISNNMIMHNLRMHTTLEEPIECCGEEFFTKGDAQDHRLSCHSDKMFTCQEPMCNGKSFGRRVHYNQHIQRFHHSIHGGTPVKKDDSYEHDGTKHSGSLKLSAGNVKRLSPSVSFMNCPEASNINIESSVEAEGNQTNTEVDMHSGKQYIGSHALQNVPHDTALLL